MADPIRPLTPKATDEILAGERKLWGASAIAAFLGISVDKVYTLAKNPVVPVYKPEGGGYFAFKSELMAWLRTKPPE